MSASMQWGVVFPGQGSQHKGMLTELIGSSSTVKAVFEQGSAVLGYDLIALVTDDPDEVLNQTALTQPVLLTAGVALYRLLQEYYPHQPTLMAGHSLGEYTALVCAGSLSFSEGIKLVAERGRLMQTAVPEGQGAMAAIIGLSLAEVTEACMLAAGEDTVSPANINGLAQIVISGHYEAVLRAMDEAKQKGAKLVKLLPVSVPSHCALMKEAAMDLHAYLAHVSLQSPQIPILHNVDVHMHQDIDDIRDVLVKQLYSPVRWVDTVDTFAAQGVTRVLELGPGQVLTGLNKRINKTVETYPIVDRQSLDAALSFLAHA